jgi:UDP-glucose:(heptosyl)LPS alpha-1,3-glucosyltransferase
MSDPAVSPVTRRLRIAFVVHEYNRVQGHSRYVAELAERFAGSHDVHVFASAFDRVPAGVVAHHVPAIRSHTLFKIFSFVLPASMMVGRGFDIVHAQGLVVLRPDIITAHICNGRWVMARRLLEAGKLPLRERLFGALVTPAERWSLRNGAATVIAISSQLRGDLESMYGRAGATAVIPHGVDQTQFNPQGRDRFRAAARKELGISEEDAVMFLYVGDFRKGFATAIKALASVPGALLVGVSRTSPVTYAAVAAACGVEGRVKMIPATNDIERCYAAADALVLPTPYDAFGMVITEAMACGIPVITTPLAGAAELITEDVHGLLVDSPLDVTGFAAAMRLLAGNPEKRRAMGDAAAELMRGYTWDRIAGMTLAVYAEHLARRATAAASAPVGASA